MAAAKKAAPAKKAAAPAKKAAGKSAAQATVTLRQIAATLAADHDMSKKQAEAVLDGLISTTSAHLKKGDKVRLTGLAFCRCAHAPPAWAATRQPVKRSRSRRAKRSPSAQRKN
jgi:hypothetical protein